MFVQARLLQSDTARKVLNAPKESFKTAKQTLENCQDNLQTLGNLLHKSVAQAQSVHIQTRMVAPEAEQVHYCPYGLCWALECSKSYSRSNKNDLLFLQYITCM